MGERREFVTNVLPEDPKPTPEIGTTVECLWFEDGKGEIRNCRVVAHLPMWERATYAGRFAAELVDG